MLGARTDAMHRRQWLGQAGILAGFLGWPAAGADSSAHPGLHHPAKARRVICLFMSGGPSQMDLFDPKPKLKALHGQELPPSVRDGQRFTDMTENQKSFPLAGSPFQFVKAGRAGMDFSELIPHMAGIADEMTVIRSMRTEPINHDTAVNFWLTGSPRAGRPTLGAWLSYALGSGNRDLPAYVVLLSGSGGQPLQSAYWANGFLPPQHQGTQFRDSGDALLYLNDPPGISPASRQRTYDALAALNKAHFDEVGDPEIAARIHAYDQASRLQRVAPELVNLAAEPKSVLRQYGVKPGQPSFAANCLLARRLVERGVRFVQLCHRDWDHHSALHEGLPKQCRNTDRASAALVNDLKSRGLLDDTLVIWGGEFGRTAFSQGELTLNSFGRDHHPRCFTIWMAGGGFKRGFVYGKSDEFGYNLVENPVHVHDLQATVLHALGIDHTRLTFRYQGRDFRLTDTGGRTISDLLA